MRRVAVLGSGGAGKSTFARELGRITGLPVVHLDRLFWRPGWVETPREEFVEIQGRALAGDAWIVDGNYSGTIDVRLSVADTLIFLDLPRALCVWRVLMRPLRGQRADLPSDLTERFGRDYLSFLLWIWNFPTRSRPTVLTAIADHPHLTVHRLRSRAEVRSFLDDLRSRTDPSRM